MSDLTADFDAAVARSKSLPSQGPQQMLQLYGLFKQATKGDVAGKRPGMLDVRGRAKFDAWKSRSGLSSDEARTEYIATVDSLAGN